MQVPKAELPNMERVAAWARERVPEHYEIIDVRCEYGSKWPSFVPDDFRVIIEYVNRLDAALAGSDKALEAHHEWSEPLIARIRAEWPPPTIVIEFQERAAK